MRTVSWALTSAAALAATATVAQAEVHPVGSPVWVASVQAGVQHWGAEPCNGDVTYAWAPLPEGVVGYATSTSPSFAPADPARFHSCRIELNPDVDLSPEQLCTALAHELGHLRGLVHSADPNDLMSPSLGDPLPECVSALAPLQPAAAPVPPKAGRTPKANPAKRHRHHPKRRRGRRS